MKPMIFFLLFCCVGAAPTSHATEKDKRVPKGALRWGIGFELVEQDAVGALVYKMKAVDSSPENVGAVKRQETLTEDVGGVAEVAIQQEGPVQEVAESAITDGELVETQMEQVAEPAVQGEEAGQTAVGSTVDDGDRKDDGDDEGEDDGEENGDEGGDEGEDSVGKLGDDVPPPPAATASQLPLWTTDVIATTMVLIPVILAITVLAVLFLFLLMHCCAPRKVTHVTNNTFTTRRYVSRHVGGEKPATAPEGMLASASVPTVASPPPSAAAPPSSRRAADDISPSSALYMPHYPSHQHAGDLDGASVPTKWHHGLLDLGGSMSPRPGSFFRTFVPASLRTESTPKPTDATAHNLREAARRLQTSPTMRPDNATPASLATGLRDSTFGRETLRDRRRGMRDSWLDALFADRAPGTENLVILEQRDGALRGASVGGAIDPEAIVITSTSSTTPSSATPRIPAAVVHVAVSANSLTSLRADEYASAATITSSERGYQASQSDLSDARDKENISPTPPAMVKIQFRAVPSGQVLAKLAEKGAMDAVADEPEMMMASLDGAADAGGGVKEEEAGVEKKDSNTETTEDDE